MDAREGERPRRRRWLALVVSLLMLLALGVAALVANGRSVRATVRTWRTTWDETWSSKPERLGEDNDSVVEVTYDADDGGDVLVEFSIETRRGKVWFLGHIRPEKSVIDPEAYADKLPLELAPDRAARVQVRSFEGVWEISIDGGRWREVVPDEARGGPTGGFGFAVEPGGACEVKGVRVKVLSTSK
jgi:hypothetical protein